MSEGSSAISGSCPSLVVGKLSLPQARRLCFTLSDSVNNVPVPLRTSSGLRCPSRKITQQQQRDCDQLSELSSRSRKERDTRGPGAGRGGVPAERRVWALKSRREEGERREGQGERKKEIERRGPALEGKELL